MYLLIKAEVLDEWMNDFLIAYIEICDEFFLWMEEMIVVAKAAENRYVDDITVRCPFLDVARYSFEDDGLTGILDDGEWVVVKELPFDKDADQGTPDEFKPEYVRCAMGLVSFEIEGYYKNSRTSYMTTPIAYNDLYNYKRYVYEVHHEAHSG